MALPQNAQIDALFEAILKLEDREDCRLFLEDLCTGKAVRARAQRLEIARRLDRGDSCVSPAEHTGASSAPVSRATRGVGCGSGG